MKLRSCWYKVIQAKSLWPGEITGLLRNLDLNLIIGVDVSQKLSLMGTSSGRKERYGRTGVSGCRRQWQEDGHYCQRLRRVNEEGYGRGERWRCENVKTKG